ncbi:MAG: SMI1/KNR4 family protein [Bacteroidetes bacterium]|nr:SMI1/KNR4 family protein [Bacteroidota bacterium]
MNYIDQLSTLFALPANANLGFSEEAIFALENRLELRLPAVLKTFYRSLGRCPEMNASHNRLIDPAQQVGFSADDYLVFYEENQVVAYWGIKATDLSLDNPPVYGNYSPSAPDGEWLLDAEDLETFLLLMSISNGVLGGLTHNANSFEPLLPQTIANIEANWKEVHSSSLMPQRVFSNDFKDVICIPVDEQGNSTGILVGSCNRDAFDRLLALDVNWYFTSDDEG